MDYPCQFKESGDVRRFPSVCQPSHLLTTLVDTIHSPSYICTDSLLGLIFFPHGKASFPFLRDDYNGDAIFNLIHIQPTKRLRPVEIDENHRFQVEVIDLRFMKFFVNMFETWFRRNFYWKCDPNIKLTLTRIEFIKRRRKAMEKFLRNDIADLLRGGFVAEAYRRAGQLYLDQIRSKCYDLTEQFCMLISNHLTTMNEQSECPEECREAVSSLMYAAARFADLPELRELRSLFSERYGILIESFVNKEFVNLFKPDRPTDDMKIQLMQEIALEHGVEWDPNSLQQNSYKPPSPDLDLSQNMHGDEDKESHKTLNKNGLRIQETGNNGGSNGEIEKKTDQMRKRILDYWSRTTSLLSTSRDTNTSTSSEYSSSSDESIQGKSFFGFRFMPNKKGTNSDSFSKEKHDNDKENQLVLNNPHVRILDDEATSVSGMKNKRLKKGGAPQRVKSHSTECLPDPVATKAQKGHVRSISDLTANPPKGHVHPKLPDYDDIKARFAALRAKS